MKVKEKKLKVIMDIYRFLNSFNFTGEAVVLAKAKKGYSTILFEGCTHI